MPTITEQLTKLEKRRNELLEQRKNQLSKIAERTKSLGIDDDLFAGALAYIGKHKEDPDNKIIKEMKELGAPFRKRSKKGGTR